jgi:hypothetical protein
MVEYNCQLEYNFDQILTDEIKHEYIKHGADHIEKMIKSFNNKIIDDVYFSYENKKRNTIRIFFICKLSKKIFMNIDITKRNEVKNYFELELGNVLSQISLVIAKFTELESYLNNINDKNNETFEANKQAKKTSKKTSKKVSK